MVKIIENVYLIHSNIVNQYLVVDKNEILLIDTGLKGNEKNIDNSMCEIGLSIKQITKILITHADGDHYGALKSLIIQGGALAMASQKESEAISIGKSSRKMNTKGLQSIIFSIISPLFSSKPVKIKVILKNGDEIPILGGLKVLSTPGHTPDHISFYSRKTGILFSGDSIRIINSQLFPSSGSNTWDYSLAKKSFDLQMALMPKYICGGHGFYKNN